MKASFYSPKKIGVSLFFALLFSLLAFHRTWICFGVERYLLAEYFPKGKVSFSYHAFGVTSNAVYFHDASVKYTSSDTRGEKMLCELGYVKLERDGTSKKWGWHVIRPNIEIDFATAQQMAEELRKEKRGEDALFRGGVKVEEGNLRKVDWGPFFSGEIDSSMEQARFTWKKDKDREKIDLSFQLQNGVYSWDFSQFDLHHFSLVVRLLFPESKKRWFGIKGKVDGEVQVQQKESFRIGGALSMENVGVHVGLSSAREKKKQPSLVFDAEHFSWKIEEQEWIGFPRFFANFSLFSCASKGSVKGEGQFRRAKVYSRGLLDKRDAIEVDFEEGVVQLGGREGAPLLQAKGSVQTKERVLPFQLALESWMYGRDRWKGVLHFKEEVKTREGGEIYLSLSGEERTCSFFEVACRHLSCIDLQTFLGKIPHLFPGSSLVCLESGTIDATFMGRIAKGKLKECEVLQLDLVNGKLHWKSMGIELFSSQLKVRGKWDGSKENFFSGGFWEIDLDKCNYRKAGKKIGENIGLTLSIRDAYIQPSMIEGTLLDVPFHAEIEGLLNHLNLHMVAHLPKELASCETESGNVDIAVDVRARAIHQKLKMDGMVSVLFGSGIQDLVDFEMQMESLLESNLFSLLQGGDLFGSCLPVGWFQGKHLSADTMNLFLRWFKKKWSVAGATTVLGEITPTHLYVTLDPRDLAYHSPYVRVFYPKEKKETVPPCSFSYAFAADAWEGAIPLREADFQLDLGVTCRGVFGDFVLGGEKLVAKQLKMSAEEVAFVGDVMIDYAPDTHTKIALDVSSIRGEVKGVKRFFPYFSIDGKDVFLTEGVVTGGKGSGYLRGQFGEVDALFECDFAVHLQEGKGNIGSFAKCSDVTAAVAYSKSQGIFSLKEVQGSVVFSDRPESIEYFVAVPEISCHLSEKKGSFDVRLEDPCYDLCRLTGEITWSEKGMDVVLDPLLSHSFGAKGEISAFSWSWELGLTKLDLSASLSALDCYHHLDFLSQIESVPIQPFWLEKMQAPHCSGELQLKCTYDREKREFLLLAHAEELLIGRMQLTPLDICARRVDEKLILEKFQFGEAFFSAVMKHKGEEWEIPEAEVEFGNKPVASVRCAKWNIKDKTFCIPVEKLEIPLRILTAFVKEQPSLFPFLEGNLSMGGEITGNFSRGLREGVLECAVQVASTNRPSNALAFKTLNPLSVYVSLGKQMSIGPGEIHFFHQSRDPLWAQCSFDRIVWNFPENSWKGKEVKIAIPPETLVFFTTESPIKEYIEERISSPSVRSFLMESWNNHIEATFDIYKEKDLEIQGRFLEGYYWWKDHAWRCKDCFFSYSMGKGNIRLQTEFQGSRFELGMEMHLYPQMKGSVTLWEISSSGPLPDPLVLEGEWREKEGFFIRKLVGKSCGLECCFHHHPKGSIADAMILTGQLKIDFPQVTSLLPKEVQRMVQNLEIGSGYELSGDVIFPKKEMEKVAFQGYLKGKSCELLGSQFETLLSKLQITREQVVFADFRLSDQAGIVQLEEMSFAKKGKKWVFSLPHLLVQDLRPSRLKKIESYRKRIKPLTIRKLEAHDIGGELADPKTWVGEGSLYFTNTFKSNYHLLDLPLEIIGRLGLDLGLLIPVRGELDYSFEEGKIYLTDLRNSYSDGKLSQFFLSSKRASSIDFDGSLDIHVKTKQYVLLKFTEPFTLSITGSLQNPSYSLH